MPPRRYLGYECTYVPGLEKVCIADPKNFRPENVYWYSREELEEKIKANDFFRPLYELALEEFLDVERNSTH